MEDLWGSPWAADSPAKLDEFPAAPQTAHFPVQPHHHSLPRKTSQNLNLSPWNDDDASNAWGAATAAAGEGWNHGIYNGGQKMGSSAWRKSPALRPLDAGLRRQPSPDPWKEVELDRSYERKAEESRLRSGSNRFSRDVEEDKEAGQERSRRDGDSKRRSLTAESALKFDLDKQDGWVAEEKQKSGSAGLERYSVSAETPEPTPEPDRAAEQEAEEPSEVASEPVTSPSPYAGFVNTGDEFEFAASEDHAPRAVAQPSVSFSVDFAALDALFPTTGPIDTQPEPVPDVIIDNTFTTISERKTWYRISRYGSSRKHDSGEDENYLRVSWAGSEVRDRTLKTVRRWMEEDAAHGGRVLLGGRAGASGASMFNWDSKAPPVEISQLLSGRAKKAVHGRHASVMNPPRGTPAPSVPTKKRPVSMIQLGNASSSVAQSLKSPPPLEPLSPFKMAPMHSPRSTSPIRPSNLKTVKMADDSDSQSEEDDDDEWGEMVGTPTVEAGEAPPFEVPFIATPPPITASKTISNTKPLPSKILTNLNPAPSSSSSPLWDLDQLEDTWGSPAPSPKPLSMTPSFSTGHATPTTPTSKSTGDTSSSLHSHKTSSPLKPPPLAEPSLSSPATSLNLEKDDDDDMDDVVASIVSNLPDLTYMLR